MNDINQFGRDFKIIDNIHIDKQIFKTFFCCDLFKCKGICCVVKGTLGPPVFFEEIGIIEKLIPDIISYFEKPKLDYLYSYGFYENYNGKYYLKTLFGDDCLFSYYDNDIAKCIFQKAYLEEKISFKKPISCDLFPIRMYNSRNTYLNYEKIKECNSALEKGKRENIRLLDFVSDALSRIFGIEFVHKIKNNFIILE